MKSAFLIVFDSVGIGAAPDAVAYGDEGANTLGHLSHSVGGLSLPTLSRLGLGCIPSLLPNGIPIAGVPPVTLPEASYGALQEMSQGKDTTTGHWEIAGLEMEKGFHLFPKEYPSFPADLTAAFERRTGRRCIGNKAASGLAIIDELGPQQMRDGCWIVYTSADSVFQIAAHEDIIPLEELYRGCEIARELCNPYVVGRVIARPYLGKPGAFKRTENRRDFSYPLPEETILDKLQMAGIPVTTVGKIDDIYDHRGIARTIHVENNPDTEHALIELASGKAEGLIFANLIDFDMLYGHRRDATGYAKALEQSDRCLARLLPLLSMNSLLIITADHGNDPTFPGSDHTREFVPLICHQPGRPGKALGIRRGFFDIAQSLATFFGLPPTKRGRSFIE